MADNKELKPKSFRIDESTAEKFKEISTQIGGNQQETLSKLIEAFEFQTGKAILTEKKADIEQFETYITALTRMYMGSLEDNQNVTATVHSEFDALLKSKDSVIQDLQEKLTVASQLKEEATAGAKEHADENTRLKDVIEEHESKMDDMKVMLSDKENLNKALTDSYSDLKQKAKEMQQEIEKSAAISTEFSNLKQEAENLKKELERQKEQGELTLDKTILEMEKKHQEQIQKMKQKEQGEIDKYQKKYLDLLSKIESQKTESKKKV